MAIIKSITLPSGYTAEYHHISDIKVAKNGGGYICVNSFKDSTARLSGAAFVKSVSSEVPENTFDISDEYMWSTAYTYIKSRPEWEGATDA